MAPILGNTVIVIYIAIMVFGLINYKKLDATFRVVFWTIVYINLHENQTYLFPFLSETQLPAHLFCVIMTALCFFTFQTLMKASPIWKFMQLFFVIVLIAIILNSIFFQDIDTFPTIGVNLFQLFFVINSGSFFFQLLNRPNSIPIFRDAVFWYNTSTFIYYSTSYFIFTIPYFLISHEISVNTTGVINIVLCLIYYPLIGYALYLNANRAKYETSN